MNSAVVRNIVVMPCARRKSVNAAGDNATSRGAKLWQGTIALDAGFGSLGPFNRAFREAEGMTPSEYRARAMADSGTG